MVLCDDLSLPLTEQELARRKFLGVVGASALGAAFVGTAVTTLRFLEPNVLFEEDSRVGVGRPEDILPGTVLVLPQQKLYVVRTREGFYALSSVCTHLGCMTRYERAGTEAPPPSPSPGGARKGEIACPCHGSRFSLDGKVTEGPAPRSLRRLKIFVERGVLVVDSGQPIAGDAILKVT